MEELMSQANLLPHGATLGQVETGTNLSEILTKVAPPSPIPAAQVGTVDDACMDDAGNGDEDEEEMEEPEEPEREEEVAAPAQPAAQYPNQGGDTAISTREACNTLSTSPEAQQEPTRDSQRHRQVPYSDISHSNPTTLQTMAPIFQSESPTTQHRTARAYVDAYFQDIHRVYPFVDRDKVISTLNATGDVIRPSTPDDDVDMVVLYLVMAIGCTTLQRTDAQDLEPCFAVNYKDLMSRCIVQESADSVQVLLLLAIHSLFDPWGFPTASLIDLLARQAIRLGLTRRHTADWGVRLLPAAEEHSHRLFWSIYALDRTIAFSTGMPVALNSTNMDIPLPCITVDEFASPRRVEFTQTLQVARHIIQLRILEDRVLHDIHLRSHKSTASLTRDDRRSITSNLRTVIENWYSNGCLLQSAEPDDAAIHIRISWLASRYYNLLLLLYYPSHFNPPSAPLLSQSELVSLAQKHIQAVSVRFHQRQLPLNHLTLCRLFPVCMIFMRASLGLGSDESILAKNEISTCADILEAFPEKWTRAHRAAAAMRQLLSPLASTYDDSTPSNVGDGPRAMSKSSVQGESFSDTGRAWRFAIKTSLVELEGQVLGRGSAFWQSKELWEDASVVKQSQSSTTDHSTNWSDAIGVSNGSAHARPTSGWDGSGAETPSLATLGGGSQSGLLAESFNSFENFSIYDLL